MPIVVQPNTDVTGVTGVPVCFQASATVVIPQEDHRLIDLPASGTNWTYSTNTMIWKRTGGANADWSQAQATVSSSIFGLQPFYISGINLTFTTPTSPNRFYACQWGVVDNTGNWYAWYLWKNCGSQSPSNCGGPNTDNSRWTAFVIAGGNPNTTPVATFFCNFIEEFRLRSDGTRLHWDWKTANIWRLSVYSIPLPAADTFQFRAMSAYNDNEIYGLSTFKGSYVGNVETTWTAPLGGTITGTGNNRCFTADTAGTYQVCVDSEFDDPVCVDVEISPLYFEPVGLNCGECVFVDTVVKFTSNGGLNGTMTANGGTVIDALTWQAPSTPGTFLLTYTISGISVQCAITVINKFVALNVDGDVIRGLVPGDTFKILTNYDSPNGTVVWQNLNCANIVQYDGTVVIPKASTLNCFGALNCSIRAVLTGIDGGICTNLTSGGLTYLDFTIVVDPVFPTPDMGGPNYVKWKQETPDYRVIVNEFEGGCDETYIRNKVPVYKWQVRYAGLTQEVPCLPEPCCDEPVVGYVGGFGPEHKTASTLDDFWNLVYGQYGYFTLIDPRTGKVWERVRFDGTMERDHINWRTTQSRDFTLVWKPCCASEPQGGTCPHKTIIYDIIAPAPPEGLTATSLTDTVILVQWKKAQDNIGVKGYQIEVNGEVIDLGHYLVYYHKGIAPQSTHTYRVRAYDFSGNFSSWTDQVIGATNINVEDSGDPVEDSGDQVIEG